MWKKIPLDSIFSVHGQYMDDTRPEKINAALGILLRDQKSYVMPSIQAAAEKVGYDDYGYLSMQGDRAFLEWVREYYLPGIPKETIALQQTAGGTQACWIAGQVGKRCGWGPYLIPIPTWSNYFALLKDEKQIPFNHLRTDGEVDWTAYLEALHSAEKDSVLILQATEAHNPTGKNLSSEQRNELIRIANERRIWVYLDGAYIGLAEGLQKDIEWITELWKGLDQVMLGISFSKTATLYGHRLGALLIKCPDANQAKAMESFLQAAMRENISMPPRWGSDVLKQVDVKRWEDDVVRAQQELMHTRKTLKEILQKEQAPGEWIRALEGSGLFSILPIAAQKVEHIRQKQGVYILPNRRINISGFIGQEEKIACFLEK